MTSNRQMAAFGALAALAGTLAATAMTSAPRHGRRLRVPVRGPTVAAAQELNRAAGTLAFSVLADSAVEHYRGAFQNRAMYTPLAVASMSLAASAHGLGDRRSGRPSRTRRDLCAGGADRTGRHRLSRLQHRQAHRRLVVAEPVLFCAGRRAGGPVAVRAARLRRRAGARQSARRHAEDLRPAGGACCGGADQRRSARHSRRGRTAAFPRRLPRPGRCSCR